MARLVTTAGSASANSYCSISEAEDYFIDRLHKSDWSGASGSEKQAGLIWATRLLDEICDWHGIKVTDAQALRWPRNYVTDPDGYLLESDEIPVFLKRATAEFAMYLIAEDRTLETNRGLMGFKSIKVDVISLTIDKAKAKKLMPPSVWTMVRPYAAYKGTGQRTTVRV